MSKLQISISPEMMKNREQILAVRHLRETKQQELGPPGSYALIGNDANELVGARQLDNFAGASKEIVGTRVSDPASRKPGQTNQLS